MENSFSSGGIVVAKAPGRRMSEWGENYNNEHSQQSPGQNKAEATASQEDKSLMEIIDSFNKDSDNPSEVSEHSAQRMLELFNNGQDLPIQEAFQKLEDAIAQIEKEISQAKSAEDNIQYKKLEDKKREIKQFLESLEAIINHQSEQISNKVNELSSDVQDFRNNTLEQLRKITGESDIGAIEEEFLIIKDNEKQTPSWDVLMNNEQQFKLRLREFLTKNNQAKGLFKTYYQSMEQAKTQALEEVGIREPLSWSEIEKRGDEVRLKIFQIIEDNLDAANIPALLDFIFDTGNGFDNSRLYQKGLEDKNDQENSTFKLLSELFNKGGAEKFFKAIFNKDTLEGIGSIPEEMVGKFSFSSNDPEKKEKQLVKFKQEIAHALREAYKAVGLSREINVDNLNLSSDVWRLIMKKAEEINNLPN